MTATGRADLTRRFTPDKLAGLDEPVRRYFNHAIAGGSLLPDGVRMTMRGRIKVGVWLPFTAVQTVDGRSFAWQARVGRGPLKPLRVTDRYADSIGRTEGRLLGHLKLFGTEDFDTARSAATRAAIESVVFAPPSVLPDRGVDVASRDRRTSSSPASTSRPSTPRSGCASTTHGALRTVSALRWGNAGEPAFQYIPFGGEIHAERRFGDLVLPSSVSVGWWFGTPRYEPFFKALITDVASGS